MFPCSNISNLSKSQIRNSFKYLNMCFMKISQSWQFNYLICQALDSTDLEFKRGDIYEQMMFLAFWSFDCLTENFFNYFLMHSCYRTAQVIILNGHKTSWNWSFIFQWQKFRLLRMRKFEMRKRLEGKKNKNYWNYEHVSNFSNVLKFTGLFSHLFRTEKSPGNFKTW